MLQEIFYFIIDENFQKNILFFEIALRKIEPLPIILNNTAKFPGFYPNLVGISD